MTDMVPMYGFGGGDGSGGTLTVTAPAGCTVTVTKDAESKTKVADSEGIAVLKGLSAGIWEIAFTDGSTMGYDVVEMVGDKTVSFWDGYLYRHGDECVDKTGGWLLSNAINDTYMLMASCSAYVNSTFSKGYATAITSDFVYIKEKSNLVVVISIVNNSGFSVEVSLISEDGSVAAEKTNTFSAGSHDKSITLDISSLTGYYRVKINATISTYNSTAIGNVHVTNVRCE